MLAYRIRVDREARWRGAFEAPAHLREGPPEGQRRIRLWNVARGTRRREPLPRHRRAGAHQLEPVWSYLSARTDLPPHVARALPVLGHDRQLRVPLAFAELLLGLQ